MNRVTLSIVLLFALLAWLGSQIFIEDDNTARSELNNAEQLKPNYQAYAMHSVLYTDDGRINHEVFAQQMAHYDKQGYTLFTQPSYVIYTENRKNPWQISALEGKLTDNQRLILEQGVVIQSTDDNGLVQTMQTSYIELDLTSKDVVSQHPVTITGDNYMIQSKGIKANLQSNTFEIGEHVETTFQPSL